MNLLPKKMLSLALSSALVLGALSAAAPASPAAAAASAVEVNKVTVTFNGDPTTSKGVTWYTYLESAGSDLQVVEKTGAAADFSGAAEFTGRTAVSSNSPQEAVHKAEATGLKPDTSYYFRAGDKALNAWSGTGTFRTAPAGGAFTFIDLADTQAKDEEEAKLSAETLAKALATVPEAQFVVHNGDIVDTGTKEEQWNWLLGHSQESLLHTTIAPSAGNHEDKNNAFYEHFNLQQPAGSATLTGAYYSYDYSNAHFIVLNSNETSAQYANFSVAQVEWLKQDALAAKAAGAKWIIVNIHKGPYTTSNHATDTDIMGANGVRSQIAPLMAQLGIDFVVQGHDHIYARTKPIKQDGTAAATDKITETLNGQSVEYTVNPDGSIYLIPATAGPKVYYKNAKPQLGEAYYSLFERAEENHAAKYGPDPSDATRPKRSQVQNFVGITVDGDRLTAVTYEIDQNLNNAQPFIIDQFGIVKGDIPVGVTGVTLDKSSLSFKTGGEPQALTATIHPSGATNQAVTWSTSDKAVASVDANGIVTPAGAGTAAITVTTADGGFTATSSITVTSGSTEATPTPTPAPTSSPSAPTPAPTSSPSTPAPSPSPSASPSTPAPTPAPTSSPSTPAPSPSPSASPSTPAPTPAPTSSPSASAIKMQIGSKRVTVNGKQSQLDTSPFILNNTTYVPLRFLSESLGANATYSVSTKAVVVKSGKDTLTFWIGKKEMDLNGTRKALSSPAVLRDNRTVLPIRFLSELLGWNVHFDTKDSSIYLTK
ncbi:MULTISPECIES: stalk domain-containing protein [unclassified Paenibacillus]|uniref:stalk domain-containing protein n=1 Tax=unclassified Paenibacillus TaxID=185978 RepID=UPI000956DE10|nr:MULTISPECIES: stalk domain-containing protein [unclassified Paenibacillus]ASS66194.2 hypothetical protein CIC07_08575 [Paenibacillus sp. RUD330]SIQ10066.1 Ig-like domain (group 2) [Paenibacillus sp. RU4X]SIQ30687.1 Ig-like domain (group 2) [Paenibacillus sp. RU4T]